MKEELQVKSFLDLNGTRSERKTNIRHIFEIVILFDSKEAIYSYDYYMLCVRLFERIERRRSRF